MYSSTSWHQGRADQKTKCVTALEWPGMAAVARRSGRLVLLATRSSPGRHYRCPSARTVKLFVWGLSLIFCMPYFVLDLLTLFHICYSNSGENLGKSSSDCLFCPNLAPKTDENFSQWWWFSLQDIQTPNGEYIHHKIPHYLMFWGGILVIRIGFLSSKWWFWLSADGNLINCYFYQQPLYNHMLAGE